MEARLAKVEVAVEHLQTDVTDMRQDIKTLNGTMGQTREQLVALTGRMDHLPSKWFIVKALMASLAVVAGLTAYAERIQALVN